MLCNGNCHHLWISHLVSHRGLSLTRFYFYHLYINEISNFAANGCLMNLFGDDIIVYTSGDSIEEVQNKLQTCLVNIYKLYSRNRLLINIDKSKVMIIGSIWQLKSLNLDDLVINYNDTPLELVERAKYLGMIINSDISWDCHIQNLCNQMRYLLSLSRRLRSIFPENLLLQVYKFIYSSILIMVLLYMDVQPKKTLLVRSVYKIMPHDLYWATLITSTSAV